MSDISLYCHCVLFWQEIENQKLFTYKHLRTAGVVQPFCVTDTVEYGAEIQYLFYSKALSVLNVSTCLWGPYLRRRFSEGGVY